MAGLWIFIVYEKPKEIDSIVMCVKGETLNIISKAMPLELKLKLSVLLQRPAFKFNQIFLPYILGLA